MSRRARYFDETMAALICHDTFDIRDIIDIMRYWRL
jgi:hypothetical protein